MMMLGQRMIIARVIRIAEVVGFALEVVVLSAQGRGSAPTGVMMGLMERRSSAVLVLIVFFTFVETRGRGTGLLAGWRGGVVDSRGRKSVGIELQMTG